MFKIFKTLILVLFIVFIFPDVSKAQEYTNYNDFIENGKALDSKLIEIKGETIKESMRRGEYAWINISDGSNAMGIWLKNEEADKIKTFGNYKFKGDIVKVSGIFNRACSEHGGDMDIHGERLTIEEKGYKVDRHLNNSKVIASIALSAATLVLFGVYYVRRIK
jgi:hypothetical protein